MAVMLPFVLCIVNLLMAGLFGVATFLAALTTAEKDRHAWVAWLVPTGLFAVLAIISGVWWYAAVWWPK